MINLRKTKIICTLGPSTDSVEIIKDLINAGLNAARFNFSHGTHDSHRELLGKVKAAREELNVPVALMLDTKGPEIRIKTFKNEKVQLTKGDTFTLTTEDVEGDETKVAVTYDGLTNDLKVGSKVLLDDGLIELKVDKITDKDVVCTIINGGVLKNRKGVNIPDVSVSLPALTEKDIEDIIFGIKEGFDYVAASFIRSAADVKTIREVLNSNGGEHIHIISKIENREGVDNIDEIIEASEGIMVARGDLGVEINPEEVPIVQKTLIRKCNEAGKPVITATQMLESMMNNPRPTRAEANDVANAIFDGSDVIMLSGETAGGSYPVESVSMMARIAEKTEESINYYKDINKNHIETKTSVTDAISYATCAISSNVEATSILTVTNSGFTARMVSKFKPFCPIVAITHNEVIYRQMSLTWGVVPVLVKDITKQTEVFALAVKKTEELNIVKDGDTVVIVAGMPLGVTGKTNNIRVHVIGEAL